MNNLNQNQDTIVSEDAIKYFKENGITSTEWIEYCQEKYGLEKGDHVFYIGNKIGYRKHKQKNE